MAGAEFYMLSEDTSAFGRVEVDVGTGAVTLYKFVGWQIGDTVYRFGENVSAEVLLAHTKEVFGSEYDVVTVYAYWDEQPIIDAKDRWFTLDEAQDGKITLAELMKTAFAIDGEVGDVTDFARGEGSFSVMDYSASDFTRFTASGSVTVTYKAVDKVGNEAYCTVTVFIVDKDQPLFPAVSRYVRFISRSFFKDEEGHFVAAADGGLHMESAWRNQAGYTEALTNALNNTYNKKTGQWGSVYQTWTFTKAQVNAVQAYVEQHGLGKTLEEDALINLYNAYKP